MSGYTIPNSMYLSWSMSVKAIFSLMNKNYEHKSELRAMVPQKDLLSMNGSMGFHSYMA